MKQRPWIWILGGCTIWPLVYALFHMVFLVAFFVFIINYPHDRIHLSDASPWEPLAIVLTLLQYATVLLVLVLVPLYLGIIWSRAKLDTRQKLTWSGAILLGSVVTMPIFFCQHLWKRSKDEANKALEAIGDPGSPQPHR